MSYCDSIKYDGYNLLGLILSVLSMANPSNIAPINMDTAVNAECTSYCVIT